MQKDSVYVAQADGFVLVRAVLNTNGQVEGYSGESGFLLLRVSHSAIIGQAEGVMMPVKKGDYWKIISQSSSETIYWIPIISSSGGGSGIDTSHKDCYWENIVDAQDHICNDGYYLAGLSEYNSDYNVDQMYCCRL